MKTFEEYNDHEQWLLRTWGGMYHYYLTTSNLGKPNQSQADKLRDCLQTNEDGQFVLNYVIRKDFPHLVFVLEENEHQ